MRTTRLTALTLLLLLTTSVWTTRVSAAWNQPATWQPAPASQTLQPWQQQALLDEVCRRLDAEFGAQFHCAQPVSSGWLLVADGPGGSYSAQIELREFTTGQEWQGKLISVSGFGQSSGNCFWICGVKAPNGPLNLQVTRFPSTI